MFYDFGYEEEGRLGKSYDLRLLRRLFPFARPYHRGILTAAGLALTIILLDLLVPYVTKQAVDRYIAPLVMAPGGGTAHNAIRLPPRSASGAGGEKLPPGWREQPDGTIEVPIAQAERMSRERALKWREPHLKGVAAAAAVYLFLVASIFGLTYAQVLILERTGQGIMHDLRMRLFRHIQGQSVAFFNRNPIARLTTRITNDIQNMHELFTSVIVFVFKDLILLVGIAVAMALLNLRLALLSFCVLPFVLIATFFFARAARQVFRRLRVLTAEINTRFSETIGGIRVIQLFLKERENQARFDDLNHDFFESGIRQIHVFATFMPVIELTGSLALALLIYKGGQGVIAAELSLGTLVAFIAYMRMFFQPIRDIAEKYNILQNAMSSAERIFQIMDTREHLPRLESGAGRAAPERIDSVRLADVSLSYLPGEPVLNGISLEVAKGRTLALVGPTGSGKTSIINLIIRFYDPTEGRVLISGTDVRQWDPHALRSRLALVTQDPFLFSDTIRANIAVGAKRPVEMAQVLSSARLKPVIDRLPDGLDTELSEGGASLSSGERQLICIARALAADPDLILLDEATSYIDSETEQAIQAALKDLLAGRTAIIVAHRLSTAKGADRIHVLDQGRIIETGTHAELMARKGVYWQLYSIQEFTPSA